MITPSRNRKQKLRNQMRNPSSSGDIIVKRMTLPYGGISTTAGGVISVLTTVSSAYVQAAPATEWASFAARYQQYRVRAVQIRLDPVFPVNESMAASKGHSSMYLADYIGTSVPTTANQVLSDELCQVHSTSKTIVFQSDWSRNPNAKLWNPTSAAVPGANLYGVALCSSPSTGLLAASLPYFNLTVEWLVEFRGSQ